MIKIQDMDYAYGTKKVLNQISYDMEQGQCIAILGNNGAGKSTMLKCISGIYTTAKGCVYVAGKNVLKESRKEMAKQVAYVAQSNSGNAMTVFDAVLLGRRPYMKWDVSQEDHEICEEVITQMGIQDLKMRYLDQLSGGELQKVMLARALAQQPTLLLLDEPTSNLDPKNQYEVMATIRNIAKTKNIAVVIVIHDLNLAFRYCDRFLFLKDQELYQYGPIEEITPECIQEVYQIPVVLEQIHGVHIMIPLP